MEWKTILITGAASGIGRAVALGLAAPGRTLHLCDINEPLLAEITAMARNQGATVTPRTMDVTDVGAMHDWVMGCGRLDLVIGCAGIQFTSLFGRAETADETRRTFAVNLMGGLNLALPAQEAMAVQAPVGKRRGQIALVASLGAFVSVPGASAYAASKAAIDNWLVGRSALARVQGVYLTSICPGYVRTPLFQVNESTSRGAMEPEEAAQAIIKGLARAPVRLSFPWTMVAGARIGGLLPAGFPARMLVRKARRKAA